MSQFAIECLSRATVSPSSASPAPTEAQQLVSALFHRVQAFSQVDPVAVVYIGADAVSARRQRKLSGCTDRVSDPAYPTGLVVRPDDNDTKDPHIVVLSTFAVAESDVRMVEYVEVLPKGTAKIHLVSEAEFAKIPVVANTKNPARATEEVTSSK